MYMATLTDHAAVRIDDFQPDGVTPELLEGFEFVVCQTPEEFAEAYEVRNQVYNSGNGYGVPVPDQYDPRSWTLLARDVETGKACGSLRLTPRSTGPLEAEEYFRLPLPLQSHHAVEISRFAILPEYRKGKTFVPVVSFGLFHLCKQLLDVVGAHYMVICSKPERIWTFEWIRFRRTGLSACYEKLGNAEHELLSYDLRRAPEISDGHPFKGIFVGPALPQVVVPAQAPQLVGAAPARSIRRLAVGA
jgi:hypothetical protein